MAVPLSVCLLRLCAVPAPARLARFSVWNSPPTARYRLAAGPTQALPRGSVKSDGRFRRQESRRRFEVHPQPIPALAPLVPCPSTRTGLLHWYYLKIHSNRTSPNLPMTSPPAPPHLHPHPHPHPHPIPGLSQASAWDDTNNRVMPKSGLIQNKGVVGHGGP